MSYIFYCVHNYLIRPNDTESCNNTVAQILARYPDESMLIERTIAN